MLRLLVAAFVLALSSPAFGALHVSPNGRYLTDSGGRPFFLIGDAGWSLPTQLDLPEATAYLNDRAARGFNVIMVRLIEHQFCADPPRNAYGDAPFTDVPFGTPNEAYFDHVDQLVSLAAQRGITILLAPVYLGFDCGPQGWCAEVQAASMAQMRAWGHYLGQRYSGFDNIIWLIGGDADPTPVAAKVREVALGIREHDPLHLMTCHNQTESQAISPWPGETWIDINNIYTYSRTLYEKAYDAYVVTPPRPFFLLESRYENELGTTPQSLRAQSYWATLAGGFGHVFGNCPIWHFGYSTSWCGLADWVAELDDPGSMNMTHFRRLFESRHWYAMVPDFDNTVVTVGYGMWGSTDYAMAASTQDGSSIIVYVPILKTITVDMSSLSGNTVRAWWYVPATGSALEIGSYPKGTRDFTPPTDTDWVLVLDDEARSFPPPGTPLSPASAQTPVAAVPRVSLERIEPNPGSGSALIRYHLAEAGEVKVVVLSVDGRQVRELAAGRQLAGSHSLLWDGRDEHDWSAGAGTYLVRVETPLGRAFGKMVRLN
jgi:hypothetical protein